MKLNILFLATSDQNHVHMSHVQSHLRYSCHHFNIVDPRYAVSLPKYLDFQFFDAIVIHYSICIKHDYYLSDIWRDKIRAFKGLKVQFMQDEYRWVNQSSACMLYLKIDLLFTLVRENLWSQAYVLPGMEKIKKVTVLPAYSSDYFIQKTLPIAERNVDIFYRGKILPYWLGSLSQEKSRIAEEVNLIAPKFGLTCDISAKEEDRIYGENWKKLLSSAKTVLGTESGASIWDFNSDIEEKTDKYLEINPEAKFEDIYKAFLHEYEGNLICNTISSRIFEAISLKTALVLFPGFYSGVIEPNKHYIPLNKDYSNFDEVAKKIKDNVFLQEMVDRTFEEIIVPGKYSQQNYINFVDKVLTEEFERHMISNNLNNQKEFNNNEFFKKFLLKFKAKKIFKLLNKTL